MPNWLEDVFGVVRDEISQWPEWLREQHAVRNEVLHEERVFRRSTRSRRFDPDKNPPGVSQPSLMVALEESERNH